MPCSASTLRDYLSWSAPNWRWSWARVLARNGRWHDPLIVDDRIKDCLRYLRYGDAPTKLQRIIKRSPAVAAVPGAIALAEGPEPDRLAVEARLLALEPLDAIAVRTGRQPAEIEAFEHLFFDFRERHDSSFWINARIMRSHIYLSRPQTLRTAVLRLAYHGGPAVTAQVLAAVFRYVRDHTWDTIGGAAGEEAQEVDRLTLLALATMMAPVNADAQAKLARQYRQLQRELGRFGREAQPAPAEQHNTATQAPIWERLRDEIEAAYASPRPPVAKSGVA